jgi:twinkle protein
MYEQTAIAQKETFNYYPNRGLKEQALQYYNVLTQFLDGKPNKTIFPYGDKASKTRFLDKKEFRTEGLIQEVPLFGMDKFDKGSKKSITLTEGEYDAISIYQVSNGETAAVSVKSASSAKRDCTEAYEFINSFDKIILAFDNDGPGKQATKDVAQMFDPQKVHIVEWSRYKDANEYLQNNEWNELFSVWSKASRQIPSGIIHTFDSIKDALIKSEDNRLADYPFDCLNSSLRGLHKGEFILFKGLEGIGKTEIFRALEYNVLKTTDHNMAIIRLEEVAGDTIRGIATYELQAPAMMDESGISEDDVMKAYSNAVGGRQDRLYIQSGFDTDEPEVVLNNIRFLVSGCGCKIVFLDHLSMLVTGLEDDDERKKIDYIVTKLKRMAIELEFCLVTIMHVNDNGQTRGSRYPGKIANTVIHMDRNIREQDPVERSKLKLTVEKGRNQGTKTGPVGTLYYDGDVTYTLKEMFKEQPLLDATRRAIN